ncbi:hypothetical protein MC7420_1965 [Coleofasciculus chthonoplastes PCC 7420]|uniref:Uncharacterized protein n=1 Tax=Coleofasciculus chthonoplastes PCC 7420 TaxID=118168 RepID=B4VM69_9CYAN|nr:hypothetical protein MC7420_1965 [Coleofasciculus chthonoplastes PCC 7420]
MLVFMLALMYNFTGKCLFLASLALNACLCSTLARTIELFIK